MNIFFKYTFKIYVIKNYIIRIKINVSTVYYMLNLSKTIKIELYMAHFYDLLCFNLQFGLLYLIRAYLIIVS